MPFFRRSALGSTPAAGRHEVESLGNLFPFYPIATFLLTDCPFLDTVRKWTLVPLS